MKLRNDEGMIAQEDGALTAFGLFMVVCAMIIGGLALDVANAYMARTQLQATSDAIAHTALYVRDGDDEANAISAAMDVADRMMPSNYFGNVVEPSDIEFGTWDATSKTFTASSGSDDAVFVDMSRVAAKNNAVSTYLLSFTGQASWDIRRGAVYETYRPTCFREGFVADDIIDIQSNNNFYNGFCIHSNTHVEVNNNGFFESGVIVSMPDKRDLVEPNGSSSNAGLHNALRDGTYQLRILNDLPDIIAGLEALDPEYLPPYITNPVITDLARSANASAYVPGGVYRVTCNGGGQKINFNSNVTLSNIVLVTNCQMHFAKGGILESGIIATTNTSDATLYSGALFTIGLDDSCAAGGGSQILTMGGVDFSSKLQSFGGQIIAMKDIEFSANANGIEGASFIAGGTVSGTSNMSMGFCGSGMELNFEAEYFRMAS